MVQEDALAAAHAALAQPHVHMANRAEVTRKLRKMVDDGAEKFLVISDFDHTLSRAYDDSGHCWSTYSVFENYPDITGDGFITEIKELCSKYIPIEFCDKLSVEEKIPHMVDWWNQSHKMIMDVGLTEDKLRRMVRDGNIRLRDDAPSFLSALESASVPVIVFSAGIGDIITQFLEKDLGSLPPNLHVISNMLYFDDKGDLTGFSAPLIHTFNKNSSVISPEASFHHQMGERSNVLLLGDSMGDLHMDVGVEHHSHQDSLKIAFLNQRPHLLPKYLEGYDVVLIDDQSMAIPNAILAAITGSKS